jgi:hypothetical protein
MDNQTSLATPDANNASSHPRLGRWLSQGAAAGIFAGFLFPLGLMLSVRNSYNFLFIPALPLFLFYGLLSGTFKSFLFWACTKLFRRRLGVVSRVAIGLLMVGFLIGFLWWRWFSDIPMRAMYYSGLTPSAVASLEGVRVIRLAVAVSSSTVGDKIENLTEAQLRNLITYKLMDMGIDVVGVDSRASTQATLYVDYSYSNDWKEPDFYNSNCHLRLTQDVVLHRDPHIKTEAATWEYQSGSLSAGMPQHSQINDAVDQFVRDYNRANSHAADDRSFSGEASKISSLIWTCVYLIVSAIVLAMVIGSSLRPGRTLMYGIGGHSGRLTILALITGILLRTLVVFLFMESILVLITTLQSNSQQHDIYLALLAIGHGGLGVIAAFSRFKFVTLAIFSFIAIAPFVVLFTLQESAHWIVNCFMLGYVSLWMAFLLTRSNLVHAAFLNVKQELRYYLID